MEPEVHLVEKYFQEIEHCFTMTNIHCKGRKELDVLAINPVTKKKFHIEVRITTLPSFALTYEDGSNSKGMPQKKGIDYFASQKFNHPNVVEKIKELFGDLNYQKILVVWAVNHSDASGETFRSDIYHHYGIEILYVLEMIQVLKERGTSKGSRDDILRLIELISTEERQATKYYEKMFKQMKKAKITSG